MENIKIYKRDISIILIFIGFMIFPYILRERIIGKWGLINFIEYFGIMLCFFSNYFCLFRRGRKYNSRNFLNIICLLLYLFIASAMVFFINGTGYSTIRKIIILFISIFPSILIFSTIPSQDKVNHIASLWLVLLRVFCTILILFYIFDLFIGKKIQLAWCNFYESNTLLGMYNANRFVSILGHPLQNTAVFLMLLVWTTIKKKNMYKYVYDCAIALIGIAVCGSKSGLILGILLILLTNIGLKNIPMLILILLLFGLLYFLNVFDLVFDRLLQGINSGDLSSARNTALERLISNGTISFNWFSGHEYIYNETSITAATEYPFIYWSFVFGIFYTIIQYLIYFVKPGLQVLKSKNWALLICTLVLMAYYNGNNGIVSFNDDLLMYSFNIFLIINISRVKVEVKERKKYDRKQIRFKRLLGTR